MGYPLDFALRYLGSKKRASITVGTVFAIMGVTLGVAALATIMSVTGGFYQQFRAKVVGVNAHVLVLKYSTNFREYRTVMDRVAEVDGVVGVAPFSINPMMLTHGEATATGVLVKGVDPRLSLGVVSPHGDEWGDKHQELRPVLDQPKYIVRGELQGLRLAEAKPHPGKTTLITPHGDPVPSGATTIVPPLLPSVPTLSPSDPVLAPTASAPGDLAPPIDPGTFLGGGAADDSAPDDNAERPVIEDAADPSGGSAQPEVRSRFTLPDEDLLPQDIEFDPCDDPEAVKRMPGIVVGVALAETLDLELDDCLTVTSPTIGFAFSSGRIKPPVAKQFRVIAMFEAGFDQYDSKLVYTDLYEAQAFYDHGDTVTGVEMKVDDIDNASAISDDIAAVLPAGLYHTMDWEELNHGLFTALEIQQLLMSMVLATIILVAAFTVVAVLIMVVLDKTKEISVMKAMGATDGHILRIFLYQGGIIGLTGTLMGLLLGVAVCKGLLIYGFPLDPKVYFISRLPVQVRAQEFLLTGVIAIVICLVATVIPSMYAARLRPADGFRQQ